MTQICLYDNQQPYIRESPDRIGVFFMGDLGVKMLEKKYRRNSKDKAKQSVFHDVEIWTRISWANPRWMQVRGLESYQNERNSCVRSNRPKATRYVKEKKVNSQGGYLGDENNIALKVGDEEGRRG